MGLFASCIAHDCLATVGYADKLCQGIPAESFARMPFKDMNSAAFNIGHLSIYPARMAGLIGHAGAIANPAGWEDLFKAGAPCVDAGTYPSKDALMAHYMAGHQKIAELLTELDDGVLAGPSPAEGVFKERFPVLGQAVLFLCNNHQMMHLGQISAWRRVMGLGSAM
ncbi:MAG: DinB family protein [Phycisphaerales bacterium]